MLFRLSDQNYLRFTISNRQMSNICKSFHLYSLVPKFSHKILLSVDTSYSNIVHFAAETGAGFTSEDPENKKAT